MYERIDQVILLILQGKASEHDKEIFNNWLLQDDHNKKIFEGLKAYWEQKLSDEQIRINEIKKNIWEVRQNAIRKSRKWSVAKIIAAAVVSIIFISGVVYLINTNYAGNTSVLVEEVQWIEKSTVAGVKLRTALPDGSLVHLNSESRIKYSSSFNDSTRELHLSGEAYFEIVPNEDKPFTIRTKDVITTVLGTTFVISAYDDHPAVKIALETGSLKTELTAEKDPATIILTPGEYIKYNGNSLEKGLYDKDDVFGWKDGLLIFRNDSFDSAMDKLKRWYGVQFIRDGDKPHWNLNGEFQNASLEGILETIGFSENFSFEFINGKMVKLKLK
jgi:transmembrane sensor